MTVNAAVCPSHDSDGTGCCAIAIGIGSLAVGWFIYNAMCRSALIKNNVAFLLIGTVVAVGFAYFYSQVFNGRAAYIHLGAMLGTLMAANVFFIIISYFIYKAVNIEKCVNRN